MVCLEIKELFMLFGVYVGLFSKSFPNEGK